MIAKSIIVVTIAAVFGFVGSFDAREAEIAQQRYCEMVAEWDASNGLSGWPPYNGREVCK
jgi:hypothetical protein